MNIEIEARRARDQTNARHAKNDAGSSIGRQRPASVSEAAADHRLHGRGEIERLGLIGDAPPVAKDHDAVGDPPDVAEPVGDVKHADAARPKPIDHREEALGLQGRQTCCRLVQDYGRRVGGDSAGDGDKLAMSGTERAEVLIERRVEPDPVGDGPRPLRQPTSRDKRAHAAPAQSVEQQVFGDGQAGNAKLIRRLVDDDDSHRARRLRRR